jgi:hypothetical protein
MKDAKGHGSDSKGLHASGVDAIGVTRYHTLKTAYWQQAQKRGYLDPKSYEMGHGIWTSTHPDEYYSKKMGAGFHGVGPDETEIAINLHPRHYLPTPGNEQGGSADRVTKIKIPLKRVSVVEHTLPSIADYRKSLR